MNAVDFIFFFGEMCDVFIANVSVDTDVVKSVFSDLVLGEISHVRIIGGNAHIYFTYWFETDYAKKIMHHLMKGNEIKVFYKFPSFWKCTKNRLPSRYFVSKYNTKNQLRALKSTMVAERRAATERIQALTTEVETLRNIIRLTIGAELARLKSNT